MPAQRLATLLLIAIPAAPGAQIADRSAYVRVVVALGGAAHDVTATDPEPADGHASVRVRSPHTPAASAAAHGVRVRVTPGSGATARITALASHGRFKYLGYRVLHQPERLVLELWKSAPPPPRAATLRGRNGCLTLDHVAAPPGRITAAGREHGLFEHGLSLVVRRADGTIAARRSIVAARGRWSAQIGYTEAQRQAGTLEAVARSPKDGALACLAQARIVLATSEEAP